MLKHSDEFLLNCIIANKEKAKDSAAMVVHHSSNVKIKLTSRIFVKKVSVAKSSPPSVTLKKSPGVDNLPANEFLLLYMQRWPSSTYFCTTVAFSQKNKLDGE